MRQTVKFARRRAMGDPDRGAFSDYQGAGVYFGTNITLTALFADPIGTIGRQHTTRGACA